MKGYKYTTKNNTTYDGFKWTVGVWQSTDGSGELCSNGWLHGFETPEMAAFFWPICIGERQTARLYEVEARGDVLKDGFKFGATEMRLVKLIKKLRISKAQYIIFTILCVRKFVPTKGWGRTWRKWAKDYIDGKDRTKKTAQKCINAVDLYGDKHGTHYGESLSLNWIHVICRAVWSERPFIDGGESKRDLLYALDSLIYNNGVADARIPVPKKINLSKLAKKALTYK